MSSIDIIINAQLVERIAKLAKISVNKDETQSLINSMTSIIDMIRTIDTIDASSSTHSVHPFVAIEDMADDVVENNDATQHLEEHFPYFKNGYFTVPPFISQD